jgi:hypothetical protein
MSTFLLILIIGAIAYLLLRGKLGRHASSTLPQGHLPGPGTFEFDIVGESKYQAALEAICGGRSEDSAEHMTEAVLYLEDSNPHDNQAVRVAIEGQTVGYLSRQNARAYRKQLKQLGHPQTVCKCDAMIVGGWHRSSADRGHFGVKLDLPVA